MKHEYLKNQDIVIFKRYNDILEEDSYEDGFVIGVYPSHKEVDICWLEGYSSRTDSVKYEDVIAKSDDKGEYMSLGCFSGKFILIS